MVDARDIGRIAVSLLGGILVLMVGLSTEIGAGLAQNSNSGGDQEATAPDSQVNPGSERPTPDSEGGPSDSKQDPDESGKTADESEGKEKEGPKAKQPAVPPGADKQFEAELTEFRKIYERYTKEIADYQGTVDSIVNAEFKKRRRSINSKYDERSDSLETRERQRRQQAIEKFEEFLDKHPDHPTYTPDAMFRMAELTFEQENDEYMQDDARYQKEMERYQAGRRPSPPEAPRRDYSDTIAIFSGLVEQWPDYRLLDGAYYLLAYCHKEMGNPRKARDLFAELVVKRPNSEFVPEAWIRIGEYHFDRSDDPKEIALAKNAYEQAIKYEDSKFYDKALYKLAWSHYRLDHFDEAIRQFERLVEYSDEQASSGEGGGSVLRTEAIQYIAVSLAEEDWNLDRTVDENFGMPRVNKYLDEGKPYEREVLVQLVDYLFENKRFEIAVNIIRHTLQTYPRHPDNPKLHEKLIVALSRPPRKPDKAFAERGRLMEQYGPDSDWYEYQKREGNEEAVEYGDNLIRENLIQAATWYHEQAQETKDEARVKQDDELLEKARQQYAEAAQAYRKFLKRYPDDKDIYRWNFYYADSLYYSRQYAEAYEQYRVVRELDMKDNKFQADAAFNAVKSLEFQLRELVEAGRVPNYVVPDGSREEARNTAEAQEGRGEQKQAEAAADQESEEKSDEVDPKDIPEIVGKYITAMDRYVVLQLDYEQQAGVDAKLAFNAAKLFYDFKHYDTARDRFAWIVDQYPEREEAYLAGSLILETYRQEKKYDKLAAWADKLSGVLKGEQAEAVKEEVREFKLGAKFKAAEDLFSQEKFQKAAEKYVELVNEAPEHENAPRALNNAAVAYEEIKKYASAMDLYERVYREYPQNPLAGYALYRVGVNSERFFEFDNAVRTYQLFYEKYEGESPKELEEMGFQIQEKRPKALLSSAVLSENLQRYEKSARLYEKFVEQYPNDEQAPSSQWQAVKTWRKADRTQRMIEAFETYKSEFGSKPENAENVLQGMNWIAEHYESEGNQEQAMEQYGSILELFEDRELKPGSDSAYYAAKAQFQLAEKKYQTWKQIKIEGELSEQKEMLNEKIKEQKKVSKSFKNVWDYKNLEYTLASSFRVGSLFQGFAESLYQVPIPFDPGTEQYRMYRTQLEDIAIPLEDKAIKRYEKTITKARDEKIVNKWTKKTLNELNKYRPEEYPLYKESRMASEKKLGTGYPLLTEAPETEDGPTNLEDTSAGDASDQSSEGPEESSDDSTQENGEDQRADEETQS